MRESGRMESTTLAAASPSKSSPSDSAWLGTQCLHRLLQVTARQTAPISMYALGCCLLLHRTDCGLRRCRLHELTAKACGTYGWTEAMLLLAANVLAFLQAACGFCLSSLLLVQLSLNDSWEPLRLYRKLKSQALVKRTAEARTAVCVSRVAVMAFALSLGVASSLTFANRQSPASLQQSLQQTLQSGMLDFKLSPWNGTQSDKLIDKLQSGFKCCGLNGPADYLVEPLPQNWHWEKLHRHRLISGQGAQPPQFPASCCAENSVSVRYGQCKAHRIGCYARVRQFMLWRRRRTEMWSFLLSACVAGFALMAYWPLLLV